MNENPIPLVSREAVLGAFDMFGAGRDEDFEAFRTRVEAAAEAYRSWRDPDAPAWRAKDLRKQLKNLGTSIEKTLLAIDDLSQESFDLLKETAETASKAPSPFENEPGYSPPPPPKQRVSRMFTDLIEFKDMIDRHLEPPKGRKGPAPREDLIALIETLTDIYSNISGRSPTHSNTKDSIYEGTAQSHAGRFITLIVKDIDPEVPETTISNTFRIVLRKRRETGQLRGHYVLSRVTGRDQ
ncbi:MAG: hypothetical protein AAF317_15565 [Pseudomonadota bacterium]